MFVWTPGGKITGPALGNERMDMRIPFEVSTKRVKDTNKPGSKVFSFIKFRKHTEDDISDGMKKTIQKRMVLKKVYAKFLWNRKDTVSVVTGNELAGHTKSPFLIIHVTTRWTETAFAGKRYRFKFTTMGTAVDSLSIRRIVAMNHTFDVIHNIFARTKNIMDVLKVVTENSLKNVLFIHKNILQQKVTKENPKTPHE